MFIVRFVRRDGKPDEEYYYHSLGDAEYHFNLFRSDDSGLYSILLISEVVNCFGRTQMEQVLVSHLF